jgi:predicted DNA-binding transcriptional regulator YafY
MARNEQLIRQHRLLQILERTRFGRTLSEMRDDLVEELGLTSLHTRSVRRDLEALQAAGFDVASTETQRGRVWKLGPSHRGMHKITVSATELTALSLSRDLMTPLVGTPFWIGIEAFWHKVKETLPDAVWDHYEKYRRVLHVLGTPAKSYVSKKGILKTINRSILEHRVVEIQYRSMTATQPTTRKIHPYAVAFYQSSLYIIADLCEADMAESVRHLKLDRFQKATALDEWFKPRSDFDVQRHLRESIGIFSGSGKSRKFRIRLSPVAARWVTEDPWHPDQAVKDEKDGSVILTVPAAHELEVIPRVLALGAEAELLAPASCRRAIAATVQRLSRTYRKSP